MKVTKNKNLFLYLEFLFNHINSLLKVQKTCVDSLKTLGIETEMGTRNNAAATIATKISNKRNIKVCRSS